MSGTVAAGAASPFKQPKAVFAVAFACVVSFMGIGLVDPILPAISHELHASPSEVTLLFTSYLVVTAVAMLITNWVSSRLGAKKTLIAGLALIVVFSAAAGASPGIGGIIGFRAGWGVGNALFIATSLAVIVASASGGFAGAIVLYETALGVGIAMGPLLGGILGEISWRGPFFGVSALMAIALIATIVLVEKTPEPPHKTSLSAPLRALRHRGLLTMALTALCYNWGFFTVLGYAPFPMNLSPIKLGLVFTGWGILVALFAVFGAPMLQGRLGIARTMYLNLAAFAVVVLVIAIWTTDVAVLIPAVIVSGVFIGINNTVTTQAVMTVSPVERPVASAAYSFVRFIGGGLAPTPPAAGRRAQHSRAVLHRLRRDRAGHHHPVHGPPPARRRRAGAGRAGGSRRRQHRHGGPGQHRPGQHRAGQHPPGQHRPGGRGLRPGHRDDPGGGDRGAAGAPSRPGRDPGCRGPRRRSPRW